MKEKKIFITADGTPSLALDSVKETYHSRHGALQESRYVYIDKGLKYWDSNHPGSKFCSVFEMGFGTGLNALLAAEYATNHKQSLYFESVENDPLASSIHAELGYASLFPDLENEAARMELLQEYWDTPQKFSSYFNYYKKNQDYFQWDSDRTFNVIFYDAFGAQAQSEMWEEKALTRAVEKLTPGGVWVSYCAKGSVRRTLQALGLIVERLPGPPGKREMLRASKEE